MKKLYLNPECSKLFKLIGFSPILVEIKLIDGQVDSYVGFSQIPTSKKFDLYFSKLFFKINQKNKQNYVYLNIFSKNSHSKFLIKIHCKGLQNYL